MAAYSSPAGTTRRTLSLWDDLPVEIWFDIFDWATSLPLLQDVLVYKHISSHLNLSSLVDCRGQVSEVWTALQESTKSRIRLTFVSKAWRKLFICKAYEVVHLAKVQEIPRLLDVLKGSRDNGSLAGHGQWTKQLS